MSHHCGLEWADANLVQRAACRVWRVLHVPHGMGFRNGDGEW